MCTTTHDPGAERFRAATRKSTIWRRGYCGPRRIPSKLCDRLFHGGQDEPWWSEPVVEDDCLANWSPGSGLSSPFSRRCSDEPRTYAATFARTQIDSPVSVPARLVPQSGNESIATAPRACVAPRTSRRKSGDSGSIAAWRRTLSLATMAAGLMIAAFCGLPRGDVSTDASRPIAALRVGDQVVTDAPWQALAADDHLRIEDRFPRNHGGASRSASVLDSSDVHRPQAVDSASRASCSEESSRRSSLWAVARNKLDSRGNRPSVA